jgi:hypothetical protein
MGSLIVVYFSFSCWLVLNSLPNETHLRSRVRQQTATIDKLMQLIGIVLFVGLSGSEYIYGKKRAWFIHYEKDYHSRMSYISNMTVFSIG